MLSCIKIIKKKIAQVFLFPFRVLSIRENQIFFIPTINMSADSTKYLAKYISENFPDKYRLVYAIDEDISLDFDKYRNIIYLNRGTLKYYKEIMRSKFIISTNGGYSYLPLSKKQIIINTWHGGGACKLISIHSDKDRFTYYDTKRSAKKVTYFVATSDIGVKIMNTALLIPEKKLIKMGLPRNDIFFTNYSSISSELKRKYGIDESTKIVLYAPTFRSFQESYFTPHQLGPYEIDVEKTLEAVTKRFGGKWVFAIRLHPSIKNELVDLGNNVINMSFHDDAQEVLCASDILLNDYSSTMWDFVQMRKPCFIFARDLEHYRTTRGFYMEPSLWPYPLAETNEELYHNITSFDEDVYQGKVDDYFQLMGNYEDGRACEKLVNLINEEYDKLK